MKLRMTTVLVTAAVVLSSAPGFAKDCKPSLTQAGEPSVTNLLAYPSSLFAWRKAVKEKYGDSFESWRNADRRKVDCKQQMVGADKRWVCTRTAVPCAGTAFSFEFSEKLVRGSTGEQVKRAQQLLRDHGYSVNADGNFGSGMEQAVRDFQRREGLQVDGRIGKETWERLRS